MIEANKQRLCVDDYAVGQASLEQIFIAFAQQGERDQGNNLLGEESSIVDQRDENVSSAK